MGDLCSLVWCAVVGLFRLRAGLQAEILVLRHQLNVLRRKSPKRTAFSNLDRLVFTGLYHLAPAVLDALKILQPETLVRWHRAGFRTYWRWKSRPRGGRPSTAAEIRQLIREMSIANPLWGAPRIHGELLKLGIDVGQTTVAKYMAKRRRPPSQGWKTFLRNHADGIASMDLFVVPTVSFSAVVRISDPAAFPPRTSPAECNCPSERRMDSAATGRSLRLARGAAVHRSGSGRRLWRGLRPALGGDGHPDRPIAERLPWQNGYAERVIGSIRRDCLDHVVVFGEEHLRHLLNSYQKYYNEVRTHLSVHKDAPVPRKSSRKGRVLSAPILARISHRN